jgi:cephalosporin hydroxylase
MDPVPLGNFKPPKPTAACTSAEANLVRAFGKLYYDKWAHGSGLSTIQVSWLGYETLKCPLDLWVYQEIMTEIRPDYIVELGTRFGGSALFMACILELIGSGMVITVDSDYTVASRRPLHRRIIYMTGSTVEEETIRKVGDLIPAGATVMLVLDSDHTRDHVLRELRAYADLVSVGSYLVVEDTNINGHPAYPEFGPGPHEAVESFLAERSDFVVDRARERFLLTMNPGGFLRRVA